MSEEIYLVDAEPTGGADAVEELPAGGVLHDDGEMRRRQNNLKNRKQKARQNSFFASFHDITIEDGDTASKAIVSSFVVIFTHLLEADDVGVPQRPVVDDLPLHVLIDLRARAHARIIKLVNTKGRGSGLVPSVRVGNLE